MAIYGWLLARMSADSRIGYAAETGCKSIYQKVIIQEVTLDVAAYFKLTVVKCQADGRCEKIRKIFVCGHLPYA